MRFEIEISPDRIADLMVSAIEGNHMTRAWCHGVYLKRCGGKTGAKAVNAVEKGTDDPWYSVPKLYEGADFDIEVQEIVDESKEAKGANIKKHLVNATDFLIGFALMAQKYGRHFGDFMAENEDAIAADVWLQCVVLKDVVYG